MLFDGLAISAVLYRITIIYKVEVFIAAPQQQIGSIVRFELHWSVVFAH